MAPQNIIILLISIIGGIYDWKSRRIPNWLTLGTFILVLVFNIISLQLTGILNCLVGFFGGIGLLFIPYILGGMGAGDVKLLGAIGAIVGLKSVVLIFLYSAVSGLFLGLLWIMFTPGHLKFLITTGQILPQVDKKQKVPYGIAIMLGTFLYIIFGENDFFKIPSWQQIFHP